jgi:lipopolysaccharide transport protein LptA
MLNLIFQKATAYGEPAVFQQRPDDKPNDVIGKGMKLELDEVKNMVILIDNASINDGEKNASGAMITYDMANDKMKIVGGSSPSGAKITTSGNNDSSPVTKDESGRSKITISAKEREQAKQSKEE